MKFGLVPILLMAGLCLSAANAGAENTRDMSKYMTCFESLSRERPLVDQLFIASPKTVLIAAIDGDKRGFYQITDQEQKPSLKLKWIADFRPEAPEIRDATQFFTVSPGEGLPLVTIQTSYLINFSTMNRARPIVSMSLAKPSTATKSQANLIEQDVVADDAINLFDSRITFSIRNLANSYFPNTSLFSRLLGDTLEVANAIENSRGRDSVYLTYRSREGGREISKESAIQMLEALKGQSLNWASQYEQGKLEERGLDGFNDMIAACSKIGSPLINDAIQAEQRELHSFITRDIEKIRSLR